MIRHIYIGFDAIDHLAYRVCETSILDQTKAEIKIHALRDWELRMRGFYSRSYYVMATGQKHDFLHPSLNSTEFTYTRFLTPLIHKAAHRVGPCVFMDADMMLRGDIEELFALSDNRFDVMCVKHDHQPLEVTKIVGVAQQLYKRKNWASVMLFPDVSNVVLTQEDVSTRHRDWLHQMLWANNVGSLPEEWNWLDGWSPPAMDPKIVHHTRGTPDMPDWADVAYAEEWWAWAIKAGWRGHGEL